MYPAHQQHQQAYGFNYQAQGYPYSQWPAGYNQTPAPQQYGQPPPAKRHKASSSTVITRYPPPPGYVPPPNAQLPGYTPAPVAQQYPSYAGYNAQDYTQYPQTYATQAYPQQAGWQQPHSYPQTSNYPQTAIHPPYPAAQPQAQSFLQAPVSNHGRAASVSQASAGSHGSQPASTVPAKRSFSQPNLALAKSEPLSEETGFDFDWGFDELFPEDTTPFRDEDPSAHTELSLKLIVWHPPSRVKVPLPSTFEESQHYKLVPVKPDEEGAVSRYFTDESMRKQIEANVRQTAQWEQVKDDPIFVLFKDSTDYISVKIVRLDRNRPDTNVHVEGDMNGDLPNSGVQTKTAGKNDVLDDSDSAGVDAAHGDDAMDMDSDGDDEQEEPQEKVDDHKQVAPDLLGNLEQALGVDSSVNAPQTQTNKVESKLAEHRGSALRSEVDGKSQQFDNNSNGRAKRRRSEQSDASHSGSENPHASRPRNKRVYGPNHQPPPPSGPPPDYNPWNAFEPNSKAPKSPESTTSQHTTVASPIRDDTKDSNSPAQIQQAPSDVTNSGRKRGYDDYSRSSVDSGRRRQEADHPKRKRQPPYVHEVYSRRW